ncbi:hypothetical protein [Devosia beringensis]|uniref:hypothetical protein n=1 Tax=Devosia beringensis TaxID=2657486 RepID=UPI00186B6F49|nr:hypothetical protein [Devosia beringensis]
MADNWTLKGVSRADDRPVPDGDAPLAFAGSAPPRPRTSFFSIAAAVIALISLGGTAWLYAETQREIKRVSTDIAQIRLSLELFGKQQAAVEGDAVDTSTDSSADELQALANRLALVEANQASAISAATSLPALPVGDAAGGGAVATGDDCLPVGTRFMMAAGDSYPVCGTTGTVAIAAVDNGYVTLSDGTIIAQGGTVGLPGTQCMLGVMPSESDGLSGFAEVRVSC